MAVKDDTTAPIRHGDRLYIGGEWVDTELGRHLRRDRLWD